MERNKGFTNAGLLGYFLKGSLAIFVLSVAFNIAVTFLTALIPQIISFTVDSVIGDSPAEGVFLRFTELSGGREYLRGHLYIVAAAAAAIALVAAVCRYASAQLNNYAGEKMMQRMRNCLFSRIQRVPLSFYGGHRTGDIIQRCTNDAQTILTFVSGQLVPLVRLVGTIALSLAFMFMMDPVLAAIAAAFLPIVVGYSVFFDRKAGKSFKKCDEEEGVLSAYAQENLTGVRIVRAFGREKYERDKFERQNSYYTGLWVRLERFLALYWNSSAFLTALQLMTIVVAGTVFCVRGTLSAGDFIAFISYNTMLIAPVRGLGRIISNLAKARVSLGRLNAIMSAEEEDYGEIKPLSGDISLRGVKFGYGEKYVLDGIDLDIPQGSTLGIIGATGSGKSTLAALLAGLYLPSEGEICVGGKRYGEYSLASLRGHVGLVLQEGYIYSRTVGENIAAASPGADAEDVRRVSRIACLDGSVSGFEKGYDTVVGERGVTLSGGQRQRLCIARALLRNTPVTIFDDSLSAVDSATDADIREALARERGGSTFIFISHRITTVMDADKIIVLDGGKIAESGTHAELLERGGLYSRIYAVQAGLPEEAEGGAE